MNALLETTLQAVGLKTVAPTRLDLKLLTDSIGRSLPMSATGQLVGSGLANWLGTQGDELSASGYTNHGTAYSIISYILTTAAPLPWAVYALDKADNRAKPVPTHPLAALLYRPNPAQSWPELKTELEGGILLHGEVFVRRLRPLVGSRAGKTTELWALPGPCVQLRGAGGRFEQPAGYRFTDPATDKWVDYPADEILHLKRWNPSNPSRGLSPIQAGVDAVTAAKAGLSSRVRQYQNQGPAGLLYDESQGNEPWTAEQASGIQNWFNAFRPGGRRQGNLPIVTGKMGYLKLGLSPVDMDVLAAIPHDKDAVADLFHFPGQLLNGSRGTTFSNMAEAGAALYNRCVIPEETLLRDGLNRWLGPEYDDAAYFDFDVSHVPELQPNKEKLAAWLKDAYWISSQDKQRMMGVEVDESLPRYLIPAMLVPAESLSLTPPPDLNA